MVKQIQSKVSKVLYLLIPILFTSNNADNIQIGFCTYQEPIPKI